MLWSCFVTILIVKKTKKQINTISIKITWLYYGIIASEFVSELMHFLKVQTDLVFRLIFSLSLFPPWNKRLKKVTTFYLAITFFFSLSRKFEGKKFELSTCLFFIMWWKQNAFWDVNSKLQGKKVAINVFIFIYFYSVAETGFNSDVLQTTTYKMQITWSKKCANCKYLEWQRLIV